ncbi:hypothetical protein DFP72DRAFT_855320 [Ephemerocybe angulata]|uniref:Uncharacterized protein n=1 Tax=Ephemerocybe angulata TaxID=980116 RepID=A0A8H6LWF4_9AGAR|nr:hypothetical protein DFP72DRAFT_855320 [Tulosesus angulatus]
MALVCTRDDLEHDLLVFYKYLEIMGSCRLVRRSRREEFEEAVYVEMAKPGEGSGYKVEARPAVDEVEEAVCKKGAVVDGMGYGAAGRRRQSLFLRVPSNMMDEALSSCLEVEKNLAVDTLTASISAHSPSLVHSFPARADPGTRWMERGNLQDMRRDFTRDALLEVSRCPAECGVTTTVVENLEETSVVNPLDTWGPTKCSILWADVSVERAGDGHTYHGEEEGIRRLLGNRWVRVSKKDGGKNGQHVSVTPSLKKDRKGRLALTPNPAWGALEAQGQGACKIAGGTVLHQGTEAPRRRNEHRYDAFRELLLRALDRQSPLCSVLKLYPTGLLMSLADVPQILLVNLGRIETTGVEGLSERFIFITFAARDPHTEAYDLSARLENSHLPRKG